MKVFLDTDVILDLLTQREPHFTSAAQLFEQIQSGIVEAGTSPIVFSNLFYLLRKRFSAKKSIQTLQKLKSLVSILSVDEQTIDQALASNFKDFEDAIQYYTALKHQFPTLLTRNKKDYQAAKIEIATPLEWLKSQAS